MSAPRFSVLLPTHNRADVLPFAIRSALWQTEADFELLVVGDGCTDETAAVVKGFDDPRIRWFDLPKAPGIGYASRNAGLREARGQYIAYLAHDDIWFPDHLERLGAAFNASRAEFAYSRGLEVGTDGTIVPYWCNLGIPQHQADLRRGESAITMCTVAHARSCLERYGFWDERLMRAGDKEMWCRILDGGRFRNVAFLAEPTALHFVAAWRLTASYRAKSGVTSALAGGFRRRLSSAAMRLPVRPGEPQQRTAWEFLASNPAQRAFEIRLGVVQFSDALFWATRSPVGILGLHAGLALGTTFEQAARLVLRTVSPRRRQLLKYLRGAAGHRKETPV